MASFFLHHYKQNRYYKHIHLCCFLNADPGIIQNYKYGVVKGQPTLTARWESQFNSVHTLYSESFPKESNSNAYAYLLQTCTNIGFLQQVHAHMLVNGLDQNIFVVTKLVSKYSMCGSVENARLVFDKMYKRNVFLWNAIIRGYARNGTYGVSLALYYQMQAEGIKPDKYTFPFALKACAGLSALQEGREIHYYIVRNGFESDVFVGNALIDMYAKCSSIADARQVFDKMSQRDVVSWTAMIAGYVQKGLCEEALKLLGYMQREGVKPNHFTFVCVFKACAGIATLELGKQLHARLIGTGFESNVVVESALVDFYNKCDKIEDARQVFDKMSNRNVISWTAMISGYVQNGRGDKALKLFYEMHSEGIKPNDFTFASALTACTILSDLEQGKRLHSLIIGTGFESNAVVGNAIIDMYAKCGNIEDAHQVFNDMYNRDVISWNIMIAGYARNGYLEEALKLFGQMPKPSLFSWTAMIAGYCQHGHGDRAFKFFCKMQEAGMNPDQFTFASVLSACASLAVLEQGKQVAPIMGKARRPSNCLTGC